MQSRGMNSCPTRTMRTRRRIGISSAPIRCSSWSIAHGRRVFNAYNGRSMCVWSADAIPCGVPCRLRVSSFRSLLDSACVYQLGTSFLKLRVPALRFYLARHPTRTSPVPIPPWSTNTSRSLHNLPRPAPMCALLGRPRAGTAVANLENVWAAPHSEWLLATRGAAHLSRETFFAATHKRVRFLRSFE